MCVYLAAWNGWLEKNKNKNKDCTICNYAAGEIRYLTRHMGTHHFDVVACNMGVGDKHHSDALPGTVHCNM